MDKWLDLHMHTIISMDGQFQPEDLMEQCAAAGLRAVAVSDHDSVSAIPRARQRAAELGLAYLPATEISCQFQGKNFHLLGYGIHSEAAPFLAMERSMHQQRHDNAEKMMDKLEAAGFYLDRDYAWSLADSGIAAAVHMARAILEDPRNDNNPDLTPYRPGGPKSDGPYVAFGWDFCGQGKLAYVPMTMPTFEEALGWIHGNGGVAILAHPGANMGKNQAITNQLIAAGIDGIESFCSYHDEGTAAFYEAICRKNDLICSLGSDYHGKAKPNIHLGQYGHPYAAQTWQVLVEKIRQHGGEVDENEVTK